MGLDIGVGWFARWARELEPDDFEEQAAILARLNEVLAQAKMAPHHEPLAIPDDQVFETRVWGYEGLHGVRRLAAFLALKNRAPTPDERLLEPSQDPVLTRFYRTHQADCEGINASPAPRIERLWRRRPRYAHLVWHSDCEGFYLPRDFPEVVMGAGGAAHQVGMIGSSVRLLEECRDLARLIELPPDIDMDAAALWKAAELPRNDGAPWEAFGPEAFCLARLIRGCTESLRLEALLAFG